MPFNSLTDRTESSPLIPEEFSSEIIKALPQASAIMRLGRQLPNMSSHQFRMPVLSVLAQAYFVTGATQTARDYGLKQTTEQQWSNKYVYAEEIASVVPVPENVIDDVMAGGYDLWAELQPTLVEAAGKTFDEAVLYGTNAPAGTWPTNLLAGATAAGNAVALGAIGDLYADIMNENGVLSLVEQDGYMVMGHAASLTFKGKLRGLRGDDNHPIFVRDMTGSIPYTLDGMPIDFPVNGAFDAAQSLLFSGDWSQLVYSIRKDITFKVLDQAVIQDDTGTIIYNLAQQDMVALRMTFRVGWQLPNPVNRIQEVEANRYPFAVLTP